MSTETVRLIEPTGGVTQRSVKYWKDHRSELGEVVEAWVFFDSLDALLRGFYTSGERENSDPQYLTFPRIPTLILKDKQEGEMWLFGCNCGYGGEGPGGTATILKGEGFPAAAINAVFTFGVLRLKKRDENPLLEVRSKRDESIFNIKSRDPDGLEPLVLAHNVRLYDGVPTLLVSHSAGQDPLLEDVASYVSPRRSWLCGVERAVLHTSRNAAEVAGYRHGDEVFQLLLEGRSGRKLWIAIGEYEAVADPLNNPRIRQYLELALIKDLPKSPGAIRRLLNGMVDSHGQGVSQAAVIEWRAGSYGLQRV